MKICNNELDEKFPNYNRGDIDILTDSFDSTCQIITSYLNYIQDGSYLFSIQMLLTMNNLKMKKTENL